MSNADPEKILKLLLHDVQNNLQAIRMEIDLLKLDSGSSVDFSRMLHAVQRANFTIQDLGDYLTPPPLSLSEEDPEPIIGEIVVELEKSLARRGIQVRWICRDRLPLVAIDVKQFRHALERTLECCQALLKDGGSLDIEAYVKPDHGLRNVELRITASARSPIELDEREVFRPSLRVNGYKVGLGLAIAGEALRRQNGALLFKKSAPNDGVFTVTLGSVQ